MRLHKFLARAGIASRRKSEKLILESRVQVNGQVVVNVATQIDPNTDKIECDGALVSQVETFEYFKAYKPKGWVVSKKDEYGRKNIFDLWDLNSNINYVGRLDKESEGLLLLTSNGDLLQRLTHPSYGIVKIYDVQIQGRVDKKLISDLKSGVYLDGRLIVPESVSKIDSDWIKIGLVDGRYREIRRMLATFDRQVKRLIRKKHGAIELGKLEEKQIVKLSLPEVRQLLDN